MEEVSVVSTAISYVTDLVTAGITWVGQYVGAVTSNPIILFFVMVGFVGLGIGLLKRLINVR